MTLGDLNITQIPPKTSPGYTYPPKILCAAFQMQYHKPNGSWTPKEWNNTRQININDELNENTFAVQSSVTTECVPLFTAKMWIMMIMIKIMIIMKNNGL